MRLPEGANNGPYYTEENGAPWQQNGVVLEGAHAAGDAAFVHPGHIYTQQQRPPQHMPGPGYVVAGAPPFYGGYGAVPPPMPTPAPPPDDFSDYMWMENEEEFDKQVMQQLEEEALMEQCIEAMLEDERAGERQQQNGHTTANGSSGISLEEQVSKSTLNPLAAEFVPTRSASGSSTASAQPAAAPTLEKPAPPAPVEVSVNDVVSSAEPAPPPAAARHQPDQASDDKPQPAVSESPAQPETPTEPKESEATEEPKPKPKEAKREDKPKETKKAEPKLAKADSKTDAKPVKSEVKAVKSEVKPVKTEVKPVKAEVKPVKAEVKPVKAEVKPVKAEVKPAKVEPKVVKAKSDVKVAAKGAKKELKSAKSDSRVEGKEPKAERPEAEVVAPSTAPADPVKSLPEPAVASAAPAAKPINYAAAARANKPRTATK